MLYLNLTSPRPRARSSCSLSLTILGRDESLFTRSQFRLGGRLWRHGTYSTPPWHLHHIPRPPSTAAIRNGSSSCCPLDVLARAHPHAQLKRSTLTSHRQTLSWLGGPCTQTCTETRATRKRNYRFRRAASDTRVRRPRGRLPISRPAPAQSHPCVPRGLRQGWHATGCQRRRSRTSRIAVRRSVDNDCEAA